MKVRMGFVSNSSSSSFICNICGGVEVGYDACVGDFDMHECENGHVFHDSCSSIDVEEPTFESKKERIKHYYEKEIEYWTRNTSTSSEKYIEEYKNDIIELETIDEYDLEAIYKDIVSDYGISSEFCPICKMDIIQKDSSVAYLLKKLGIDHKILSDEIKSKFSNYEEFVKFIK